jgi:hypothetical protein
VNVAAKDGHCFDEEIRHILLNDGDLLQRALALHSQDFGLQIDAIRWPQKEQHRGICPVGVELQFDRLAGRVLGLVWH